MLVLALGFSAGVSVSVSVSVRVRVGVGVRVGVLWRAVEFVELQPVAVELLQHVCRLGTPLGDVEHLLS